MRREGVLTLLVALTLALPAMAAGHTSAGTLPNGTPIEVAVDSPVEGTEQVVPAWAAGLDVTVSGTASVGEGEPDATIVYVVDVSASVNFPASGDCGGDRNGDGSSNTILDCEIAGILALNDAATAEGSVDAVGVVVYGRSGAAADMTPAGGDDPLTAPDAGPGDVETVVESIVSPDCNAGVLQFAVKIVGCDRTNFSDGLAAATTVVGASTNSTNLVVFLSDGLSNLGGGSFAGNLAALAGTGATAFTFAVGGGSSCVGGTDGTLQQIAVATGGSCTQVADPSDLADVVPDLVNSMLESIELAVDGGAGSALPNSSISLPLPQDGPASVSWTTVVPGLAPGGHEFCATAFGSDAGGSGDSGEACVEINLLQIDLTPEEAFNELGTPGQTHSVTAKITGAAGTIDGRLVTFTVLSGPNAGATGTCSVNADCTTDASGRVTFTYEGQQGLAGVGTDTIEACFTTADPTGATGCDTASKHWGDTTRPVSECLPGPNPHGAKVPPAGSGTPGGKGGQNPDGFYTLTVEDTVDPDAQVFVRDSVSGTVFGPYDDGTVVKWTQAPGAAPSSKTMGSARGKAGAVIQHIIGRGDMEVFSIDSFGNTSDVVTCFVPPPPK